MNKVEFYKRLATEPPGEWLQIKVQPVLKEITKELADTAGIGMSELVRQLIIKEWERQTAVNDGE